MVEQAGVVRAFLLALARVAPLILEAKLIVAELLIRREVAHRADRRDVLVDVDHATLFNREHVLGIGAFALVLKIGIPAGEILAVEQRPPTFIGGGPGRLRGRDGAAARADQDDDGESHGRMVLSGSCYSSRA